MSAAPILIPVSFSVATCPQDPPSTGELPTGGNTTPGGGAGQPGSLQGSGQRQDVPDQGTSSPLGGNFIWIMMIGVAFMLFFSMRKESKGRKAQQAMLSSIKQGDQVVTSSGIHGTVHKLDDTTVTLLLDSAKVTFERASIARVLRDDAAQTA